MCQVWASIGGLSNADHVQEMRWRLKDIGLFARFLIFAGESLLLELRIRDINRSPFIATPLAPRPDFAIFPNLTSITQTRGPDRICLILSVRVQVGYPYFYAILA